MICTPRTRILLENRFSIIFSAECRMIDVYPYTVYIVYGEAGERFSEFLSQHFIYIRRLAKRRAHEFTRFYRHKRMNDTWNGNETKNPNSRRYPRPNSPESFVSCKVDRFANDRFTLCEMRKSVIKRIIFRETITDILQCADRPLCGHIIYECCFWPNKYTDSSKTTLRTSLTKLKSIHSMTLFEKKIDSHYTKRSTFHETNDFTNSGYIRDIYNVIRCASVIGSCICYTTEKGLYRQQQKNRFVLRLLLYCTTNRFVVLVHTAFNSTIALYIAIEQYNNNTVVYRRADDSLMGVEEVTHTYIKRFMIIKKKKTLQRAVAAVFVLFNPYFKHKFFS